MPATIEEPKQQVPMEASASDARITVVTQQPRAEPLPKLEQEMTLRGGRMNCGFTCCNGMLSCHKGCC
ncbi:hypothetical protein QBC46DRAFT_346579 [Diplogelasinospora grovesii]|uniref:Uncharacterized protein n=1 Tax=Diplogelasinospora grovesii TaxID=303347 RepID=A0AAN6S033_9PEZI|nr:hypothetical protein QBC46DRAFT_346579 [Diplogelasinospora grovesii]